MIDPAVSMRSIAMLPEERYLHEGLQAGTIIKCEIKLSELDLDPTLQCRVVPITRAHVDRLREALRETGALRPIVVFREPGPPILGNTLTVGDGFHRTTSYREEGKEKIPAYLCEGGRREAIKFATMCNQDNCLGRDEADKKKAAFLLFSQPEWWIMSSSVIADHIKIGPKTLRAWRQQYATDNKIPVPRETIGKDGKPRVGSTPLFNPVVSGSPNAEGYYRRTINGTQYNLGKTQPEAQAKLNDIIKKTIAIPAKQKPVSKLEQLHLYLDAKDIEMLKFIAKVRERDWGYRETVSWCIQESYDTLKAGQDRLKTARTPSKAKDASRAS